MPLADARCAPDGYAEELQAIEDYRRFAVLTIQRFWRGHAVRQRQRRQRDEAASHANADAAASRKAAQLYRAARAIQDAWRGRANRRIFRYYQQLLAFRGGDDPRALLRAINPREAALLDAAAGAHVRFRLGGASFPPQVLYKIFTHRPVADINAFAPRDYAAEAPDRSACLDAGTGGAAKRARRQPDAAREPIRAAQSDAGLELRPYLCPDGTTGYRTTRGWYRRSDRNGWRPAAPHLLFDPEQRAALGLNGGAASGSGGCGWGTSGAMQLRCRHDRKQRRRRRPRLASTSRCVIGETDGCESGRDLEMGGRVNHSSKKARSAPVTHHSPLVRREERARRAKQRRRAWLLQLYRQGRVEVSAAHAAGSGEAAAAAVRDGSDLAFAKPHPAASQRFTGRGARMQGVDAAVAAVAKVEAVDAEEVLLADLERRLQCLDKRRQVVACPHDGSGGGSSVVKCSGGSDEIPGRRQKGTRQDSEDGSALLTWCQALDFEAYTASWAAAACSLGSEAAAEGLLVERALLAHLAAAQQQGEAICGGDALVARAQK